MHPGAGDNYRCYLLLFLQNGAKCTNVRLQMYVGIPQNDNWQLTNKQVKHGIRPCKFAYEVTSNQCDEPF